MHSPAAIEVRGARPRGLVYALAMVLVFFHLSLTWYARRPAVGWGEDDAEYVVLAREVREFQYREVFHPGAPVHLRYPPGYPTVLAAIGAVTGENQNAYLAVTVLLSGASLALLYAAALDIFGAEIALFALAAAAFSPELAQMSGKLMSESLMLFLTTLVLWASVGRRAVGGRWPYMLAGASAIAAALTRTAGLTVVAALLIHWLLQKRYRAALLLAAAGGVAAGVWLGMVWQAPDAAMRRLYSADMFRSRIVSSHGLPRWLSLIVDRTRLLGTKLVPVIFAVPTIPGQLVDNIAGVGLLAVLLPSGLLALWRRWRLAAIYLVTYGGALLAWRFAIARFVQPLIPIGFVAIFAGAAMLLRRAGPRWRLATLSALLLYFAIGDVQHAAPMLRAASTCDAGRPYADPRCWNTQEYELLQAAFFVRDSTPADAMFLTPKEGAFYFHTGRRAVIQRRAMTYDSITLAPFLRSRGVEWAVATRVGPLGAEQSRLLARACRDFDLVRAFPLHTLIVRLRRAGSTPEWGPACDALSYWRIPLRSRP